MLRFLRPLLRSLPVLAAIAGATLAPAAAEAAGSTGLQLPRFVSLKASRVNVRVGPSNSHAVKWIFVRAGLPVEIVQEFETWRRIRDSAGAEGWVYHGLLSGRRTALVAPWEGAAPVTLHVAPDATAATAAVLEPKVVGSIKSCDGRWCRIEGKGFAGWAEQEKLWGVYPNEVID